MCFYVAYKPEFISEDILIDYKPELTSVSEYVLIRSL